MEEFEKGQTKAASEEISREVKTLIDSHDLDSLKQLQLLILAVKCRLGRLQDSNAVLSHFNDYSEHCFAEVSADFSRNTRLFKTMKADLDYIFQKLRSMKAKILSTYPDALQDEATIQALDHRPDLEMPQ
ncbi:hypothetical protein DM860_002094 [Cuscuta australis]|uniref:KxDL domain-containing protein n=1 Tax=Cuscuta australis TaxID=267555 RepID=A0A328E072_9ASTE|nr:hypothetical protein DM860_002094 [Cuscuta australis]